MLTSIWRYGKVRSLLPCQKDSVSRLVFLHFSLFDSQVFILSGIYSVRWKETKRGRRGVKFEGRLQPLPYRGVPSELNFVEYNQNIYGPFVFELWLTLSWHLLIKLVHSMYYSSDLIVSERISHVFHIIEPFDKWISVIDPVGFRAKRSDTWFASPIGASNQERFLTRARFPLLLQSTRLPRKRKSRGVVVSLISDSSCNLLLLFSQHGHHKWKDSYTSSLQSHLWNFFNCHDPCLFLR